MIMNLVKELETNVDWDRVFGVVDSLSILMKDLHPTQITLQGQLW